MQSCQSGRNSALAAMVFSLCTLVWGNCDSNSGRAPQRIGVTSRPNYGPDVAAATICRDPATGAETARYIFSDMNGILRRCPEVGRGLPFNSVETCEQAQSFSAAYRTYVSGHSRTDCEVSPEYKVVDYVEETQSALIAQPVTDSNFPNSPSPTVGLVMTRYEGGQEVELGHCSGVSIAKNYILTAKHCHEKEESEFAGFYRWKVRWATSNAGGSYRYEKAFIALQIPHDTLDLMLVYLPTWDGLDRFLPPNISAYGAYLDENAIFSMARGSAFHVDGWGLPTLALETLTLADVRPYSDKLLVVTTQATDSICPGDSGGPLYWISNDSNPVVAGLLKMGPSNCTVGAKDYYYTRVDKSAVRDWINDQMILNNGDNPPGRNVQNPSGNSWCWPLVADSWGDPLNAYRCWGDPCGGLENRPCGGTGNICVGDGSDYATATCDPAICGGGCACLVGECISLPIDVILGGSGS